VKGTDLLVPLHPESHVQLPPLVVVVVALVVVVVPAVLLLV